MTETHSAPQPSAEEDEDAIAISRYPSVPAVFLERRGQLEALGWNVDIVLSRPARPRAELWAEHTNGARLFIRIPWSRKAAADGSRRWSPNRRAQW